MTDKQLAESFIENIPVDEDAVTEEWSQEDEDRWQGEWAAENFINNHIINKINLFLDVYRKKGYSEAFCQGFMDGIVNHASSIHFPGEENNTETEETVETSEASVVE